MNPNLSDDSDHIVPKTWKANTTKKKKNTKTSEGKEEKNKVNVDETDNEKKSHRMNEEVNKTVPMNKDVNDGKNNNKKKNIKNITSNHNEDENKGEIGLNISGKDDLMKEMDIVKNGGGENECDLKGGIEELITIDGSGSGDEIEGKHESGKNGG